jgi:hypothetical protein
MVVDFGSGGAVSIIGGLGNYIILGMSADSTDLLLNAYKISTQESGIIRIDSSLNVGSFDVTDSNGSAEATPLIVLQ